MCVVCRLSQIVNRRGSVESRSERCNYLQGTLVKRYVVRLDIGQSGQNLGQESYGLCQVCRAGRLLLGVSATVRLNNYLYIKYVMFCAFYIVISYSIFCNFVTVYHV